LLHSWHGDANGFFDMSVTMELPTYDQAFAKAEQPATGPRAGVAKPVGKAMTYEQYAK